MLIYFIVFIASAFFAYLAYNSKIKFNKYFWSIIAILLPAILAGLRSKGVGTDTLHYVDGAFNFARASSSFEMLLKISNIEILYNLLNFIVSRFSSDVHAIYFFAEFIICGAVYFACCKNKKICPSWLSYFIFLLLFYNRSLNMCRQSLAISMTLVAFTYALDKKIIKYLIFTLLAIGFHRSAVVSIPIYLFVYLLNSKGKFMYKTFIIAIIVFFIIFYQNIMMFFTIETGILSSRYLYYTLGSENNIIIMEFLCKVFIVFLCLLFNKKLSKINVYNQIIIFFIIIDLLLYCLGFYANYAQRMSYYYGYLVIFIIPQLPKITKLNFKYIMLLILIICTMSYSYLYYGVAGYDQTTPYNSDILKIGVD